MAFPRKLLNEDEAIVLDLRPHWWFITKHLLLLIAAIAIGIAAFAAYPSSPLMQAALASLH